MRHCCLLLQARCLSCDLRRRKSHLRVRPPAVAGANVVRPASPQMATRWTLLMPAGIPGFVHQPSPGLRLAGQPSAYVPQSRDYGETSRRGVCPDGALRGEGAANLRATPQFQAKMTGRRWDKL